MKTDKILNGNEYTFINESFSNSRNWGHKTKLFKNNDLVAENKAIYLNRTWEAYQYQSSMKSCVYNLIDAEIVKSKLNYKKVNEIKRMTKKHQEIFEGICKVSPKLKELNELMKTL